MWFNLALILGVNFPNEAFGGMISYSYIIMLLRMPDKPLAPSKWPMLTLIESLQVRVPSGQWLFKGKKHSTLPGLGNNDVNTYM
jgi:hypothetical protein